MSLISCQKERENPRIHEEEEEYMYSCRKWKMEIMGSNELRARYHSRKITIQWFIRVNL